MCLQDENGKTALHYAVQYGYRELIRSILVLLPEAQRMQAVCVQDDEERSILHSAGIQDNKGRTVLDYFAKEGHW